MTLHDLLRTLVIISISIRVC